jgi:hypothetical protein
MQQGLQQIVDAVANLARKRHKSDKDSTAKRKRLDLVASSLAGDLVEAVLVLSAKITRLAHAACVLTALLRAVSK